jgi:hypothetical protein
MTRPSPTRLPRGLEACEVEERQLSLSCGDQTTEDAGPAREKLIGDQRTGMSNQMVEHVRVRVNSQGADYVEGLQDGRVYDAHVKPQWPDTVWLEDTGLRHSCFLFAGMYEIVDAANPASS